MSQPLPVSQPPNAAPQAGDRLAVTVDEGFASWMSGFDGSLAITTYQAGKVVVVGWDGQQVTVLPRNFDKPMGLAVDWPRMALATRHEITLFADAPLLAPDYLEHDRGRYDALLLPRVTFWTGDLHTHDIAYGTDGLWMVATRLSCLARLSQDFNLVPVWKPPFVSEIAPEDRCHLNGLCLVDGKPKYATCLGATDSPGAWRSDKASCGLLLDVTGDSVVLDGLAMPHCPRWHAGRLWVLNSGAGEVLAADVTTGRRETICTLPGYLRGLAFVGPFAVVGLSQIREKHIFGGLAVQDRFLKLSCGISVLDLQTGLIVGKLEFTAGATELFDVHILPKSRRVALLNRDNDVHRQALTAPEFAYWLRPNNVISN